MGKILKYVLTEIGREEWIELAQQSVKLNVSLKTEITFRVLQKQVFFSPTDR
jgi:hypothetical protein